jgi:hypothetical protein
MNEPCNWIDPSIEFMNANNNVLTSSPNHHPEWVQSSIRKGNFQLVDDFGLGYHFSDQLFLARTEQFARPIYNEKCIASLRYPLAHLGSIFEMRVDAYMRNHRLKKAIFIPAVYNHPEETIGLGYPQGLRKIEKLKMIRNEYIYRKLRDRPICGLLKIIGKEHLIA